MASWIVIPSTFTFKTAPPTKSNQDIKTNQNYTHLNTMSWNLCSCVNAQFLITWQKNYLADSGLEFGPHWLRQCTFFPAPAAAISGLLQLVATRSQYTVSSVFLICTLIWKPAMNLDRQANHAKDCEIMRVPMPASFVRHLWAWGYSSCAEQGTLQKKI